MNEFKIFYDRSSESWIVEEHKRSFVLGTSTLTFAHRFDTHAKLLKFLAEVSVVEHLMR